jgi:hypothetical protein
MELVGVEEISSVSIQAPIHPFVLWPFCNWILNLLDLTVNEHHRHSVAHHHKTRVCFSNLDILTNIWMLVTEILHCHCRALNPNPKVRGSRGKEMFSRREAVHPWGGTRRCRRSHWWRSGRSSCCGTHIYIYIYFFFAGFEFLGSGFV